MAEREALWGWDLDESPAELTGQGGEAVRSGDDPITAPIPLTDAEVADLSPPHADPPQSDADAWDDSERWDDGYVRETSFARPFIDRPAGTALAALTFKPAAKPWYRTKPAVIGFSAVAAVALLLLIVNLVWGSSSSGPDESTGVVPSPPTSAEPAPSSAPPSPSGGQPTLSSAPAPPPPPPPAPPPPPPPPAQDSASDYTPYYPPRNSPPSQSNKPDIDVTRAPVSVAPEVRAPPPNSAEVGEGRPRRGFW